MVGFTLCAFPFKGPYGLCQLPCGILATGEDLKNQQRLRARSRIQEVLGDRGIGSENGEEKAVGDS